jgi:hypothetical protein
MRQQRRIDAMLRWGIVFSFFWFGGLGSLFALSAGWQARKLIVESGNALEGRFKAWWCMIVGGIGSFICLAVIGIGLFNNLKEAW